MPFSNGISTATIELPGVPGTNTIRWVPTGPDFLSLYHIHLLSGRALSEAHRQDIWRPDSLAFDVLINRTAAKHFGYSPQNALGKIFYDINLSGKTKRARLTIVGVTSDFMFDGGRRQIEPTFYAYYPDSAGAISVRVPPGTSPERFLPSIISGTPSRPHLPSIGISWIRITKSNSWPMSSRERCLGFSSGSLYSLPVWASLGFLLFHRTPHQRNRHPKSLWGADEGHHPATAMAVFEFPS